MGVDIDETGVSRLQQIQTENQALAKSLSGSFNAASESVKAFREQVAQDLSSLFSGSGCGNVTENLFGSAEIGDHVSFSMVWDFNSCGNIFVIIFN